MKRATLLPLCLAAACGGDKTETPAGDTDTWTKSGSPYAITADLTIAAGQRVTIEPGVTVQLGSGVSIHVDGQLVARGTETQPILFTAADAAEPWGSILFGDGSEDATFEDLDDYVAGSILEHCIFEYGRKALQISGASPYVFRSTFRDNQTEAAIDIAGGPAIFMDGGAAPRIRECAFTDNEAEPLAYGGAIYVKAADPILQDNLFSGNVAIYGAALTTDLCASPIVGNTFEDNEATTEGGGMSLISSSPAVLNNLVTGNHAAIEGGGIHVCVDCYPHATPFLMDNTVTGNTASSASASAGAAGIGAAYVRMMTSNNLHGNMRKGQPSDFGWFHKLEEGYPDWVSQRSIAGNWWGTTDTDQIAAAIFDGTDDPDFGTVNPEPILTEEVTTPMTRVTITTRKLHYVDAGDPMPVFLTLYNPGPERDLELAVLLQYGDGAFVPYEGDLGVPDATGEGGIYTLTMPENAVHFTTLLEPTLPDSIAMDYGYWHAAIFDAPSGERIGEACSIRFDLGPGGSGAPTTVNGVGTTVDGHILAVGDSQASMVSGLGVPTLTRDIGAMGHVFQYPQHGIGGLLSGEGDTATVIAIFLSAAFGGQTVGGVGIGADRATVETALGTVDRDPFLSGSWYADHGVVIEWEQDIAARVHLF